MNARGREAWNALRASYRFVPILLALAAGALAFVTLAIDGATARQTAGRESGVRRLRLDLRPGPGGTRSRSVPPPRPRSDHASAAGPDPALRRAGIDRPGRRW